jgi:glycosyltransferase involved in cell wall biosynthesis
MPPDRRVGYVLKVYPRFSETFVVNEILAHERAGVELELFSLRPPLDGRFHELLAEVRAPVHYVDHGSGKAAALWSEMAAAQATLPDAVAAGLPELLEHDARDAHQALALARLVRERRIHHLHAHFGTVATTVARLAAGLAGVPYSFTAHAKDIFHESVDPADLSRKLAGANAVVTVSDYNLGVLRRMCPEADLRRVYNGLDLRRFRFSDPRDRPRRIVAVGRLVEKKGFADLVDACVLLARRGTDFRCDIVGTGQLEQDLLNRIQASGVGDRVRLLGPRPSAEVRRLMEGAAVLAAPCVVARDGNRDGLPTVLVEAMALGTPCVSTDVTGIPEVLRDGRTGLAVPQRDPAALAEALSLLLDDADLRSRLAVAARELVEQRFDLERNAALVREAFDPDPAAATHAHRVSVR